MLIHNVELISYAVHLLLLH